MAHNIAGEMLRDRMQRAYNDNPRGELYRSLAIDTLYGMLVQNVKELGLALEANNDVVDKIADVGNYAAFLLRNHLDPVDRQGGDLIERFTVLLADVALSRAEADILVKQVRSRVVKRGGVEDAGVNGPKDYRLTPYE